MVNNAPTYSINVDNYGATILCNGVPFFYFDVVDSQPTQDIRSNVVYDGKFYFGGLGDIFGYEYDFVDGIDDNIWERQSSGLSLDDTVSWIVNWSREFFEECCTEHYPFALTEASAFFDWLAGSSVDCHTDFNALIHRIEESYSELQGQCLSTLWTEFEYINLSELKYYSSLFSQHTSQYLNVADPLEVKAFVRSTFPVSNQWVLDSASDFVRRHNA